jgi:putative NADH-flavin reductase
MEGSKILVLGAAGGTGREVVAQALAKGAYVTALVRDRNRLSTQSDRLHVVVGDAVGDGFTLADVVRGQDAVICALGVKGFTPNGLIAQSAPLIVRAMAHHGVKRLIHVSAFGVGDTFQQIPLMPKLFVRTLLRHVYRDKAAGEAAIRGSDLEWTVVYPAGLTDGPRTGRYRSGERLELRGFPTISRADVAEFLIAQVGDATYVRKGVLVAS